eukprot:c9064_g1_i3.p1 GENE.c9064_g1_i3~~c9064_g1_i3.p1  ORF type:complete len:397 (+),score=79.35 c9064_g1_i3:84-1274(+)
MELHYGARFRKVASVHLRDMRLIVMCSNELRPHISEVEKARKATGIANIIGNKGGLMIKLKVYDTRLCFLSCHLHAHESQKMVVTRNQDLVEILKGASNSLKLRLDVAQRFDHTFLFGDLNYRTDVTSLESKSDEEHHQLVAQMIKNGEYEKLVRSDQLKREMAANRALVGFQETKINFPPTFKVVRGSIQEYANHRIPSYCDRILFSSLPGLEHRIIQTVYDSAHLVTSSDHKPVYSLFDVDTSPEELADATAREHLSLLEILNMGKDKQELQLQILNLSTHNVNEEIQNCSSFIFKCNSVVCTDKKVQTDVCDKPEWSKKISINLKPSQARHLLGTHLFITLWDASTTNKLLAQGTLSLDPWTRLDRCEYFEMRMSRFGVYCGNLCGTMQIIAK